MKKTPWKSKTLWINLVIAITALFVPQASAFIVAHPDYAMAGMGAVNALLRLVTKGAIVLDDGPDEIELKPGPTA